MTRLEYLKQVVMHLAQATHPSLQSVCLHLLEKQARRACLEGVLIAPRDLCAILAVIAQYEVVATGTTHLRKDPFPRTPTEAAVHFLAVSERVRGFTGETNWKLMMWASLVPFIYRRPVWGSA